MNLPYDLRPVLPKSTSRSKLHPLEDLESNELSSLLNLGVQMVPSLVLSC